MRWSMHSMLSPLRNSHPQSSSEENEFLVMHNDIITNYKILVSFFNLLKWSSGEMHRHISGNRLFCNYCEDGGKNTFYELFPMKQNKNRFHIQYRVELWPIEATRTHLNWLSLNCLSSRKDKIGSVLELFRTKKQYAIQGVEIIEEQLKQREGHQEKYNIMNMGMAYSSL
ncbi:MAG2-interacting protein 2 isoform X2 [Iris pallida]|uniref:MAG2-interacting protein 2 isoform X2 n=1 Tax=Iris pallida TaxID=29817 RepID=A0AAX6DPY4_IRIPA|nr:MAG2-interacting protein 2 isoform X2 [Iris pallida]